MNNKKRPCIHASDFAFTDEQFKQIIRPTLSHTSKWTESIKFRLDFNVSHTEFSQLTLTNMPVVDGTKVKQTYKLELIKSEVIEEGEHDC